MHTVSYDGSFAGLLSAVFDVYEYKMQDVKLVPPGQPVSSLFGNAHTVHTDITKAGRVWKGLEQYSSLQALRNLRASFFAGTNGNEEMLLAYIRYVFASKKPVERDYSHPAVVAVSQTAHKVRREKHRMEAFVRFQLTKDQLYYAIVQPDYNVLPLISDHFEKRYADQRWLIYDALRRYGIYYDLDTVEEVSMDFALSPQDAAVATIHDEKEELYQALWKQYFDSVNIASRKNTKLHIRHMPKRYWKYLPEKQPVRHS